ncbi:winged helix-turn-helix domain-containing protein, partial [uncultured Helicobacter sp.]
IWGYNISGTRTIDIHINTLRSKLGAYGTYIKTIRGIGYQFNTLES